MDLVNEYDIEDIGFTFIITLSNKIASVSLGYDNTLKLFCAIKSIFPKRFTNIIDTRFTYFQKTIEKLCQINHPVLVKVMNYQKNISLSNLLWFQMEYMPHQKLSTWIKTNQRADTTQILIILYGVAVGISILHANGIIHSNINISNIFIDENNFPKIGGYDFEYSFYKPIQAWSTKYKINSSSPEILMFSVQSNKIDSRTDSYAFGVIIYNIVTKTQLYQNQNQYQICNSIMNHQIPELEKNNPYREIYDYCCRNERSERPSFLEIVKMLELLSKEIKNIDINRFNQYKEYIHSQHHPSPSFSIEKLLYYSEKNVNVMRYLAVMKAKGIVLPRNAYEAEILLRNGIEKHDFAALETLVEFIDQKYIPIPNDYGELVSFYDNYSC